MSQARLIEMVRRHIAEGEKHVEAQRAVVRRLHDLGVDAELAEDLEKFEATLAEHPRRLAQMKDQQG